MEGVPCGSGAYIRPTAPMRLMNTFQEATVARSSLPRRAIPRIWPRASQRTGPIFTRPIECGRQEWIYQEGVGVSSEGGCGCRYQISGNMGIIS